MATYAGLLTPPCPPQATVIGWAEVEGVYRQPNGEPISGQSLHILCGEPYLTEPFAEAYARTDHRGEFRTLLALRMERSTTPEEPPSYDLTHECVLHAYPYTRLVDTLTFIEDAAAVRPVRVELVWGVEAPLPE